MARIVRLPVRSAFPGNVWCEQLGLFFRLYRGVVRTTAEDLIRCGITDLPDACGESVLYSLSSEGESVVGSVEWSETTHILPGERSDSFLIRHHPSVDVAHAYKLGHIDMTFDPQSEEVEDGGYFHTDAGVFTMIARPTLAPWPGALVVYLADVPFDNAPGFEGWAFVVGPNGEKLSPDLVGCFDLV